MEEGLLLLIVPYGIETTDQATLEAIIMIF